MQKGQQFAVFKLLIGAIFALGLLSIVYNVVTGITEYQPGSDVLTVSSELLASAYSAAGSGEFFHRQAKLQAQFFDTNTLRAMSGLPSTPPVNIEIHCRRDFCEIDGDPVTEVGKCKPGGKGCKYIELVGGASVELCARCWEDPIECHLYIGEDECGPKTKF